MTQPPHFVAGLALTGDPHIETMSGDPAPSENSCPDSACKMLGADLACHCLGYIGGMDADDETPDEVRLYAPGITVTYTFDFGNSNSTEQIDPFWAADKTVEALIRPERMVSSRR